MHMRPEREIVCLPPRPNMHYDLDPKRLDLRYKELQWQYHPDRAGQRPEAEREMATEHSTAINHAYSVLRNPLSRATYMVSFFPYIHSGTHRRSPALLGISLSAPAAQFCTRSRCKIRRFWRMQFSFTCFATETAPSSSNAACWAPLILQLAQQGINVDGEDAGTINDPEFLMEVRCSCREYFMSHLCNIVHDGL